MIRTIVGAMIGAALGVLAIAAWGAWDGYHDGIPARQDIGPGIEAAAILALTYAMYAGWMGVVAGGLVGGGAGLGSALVRSLTSSSAPSPRPGPSA